MKTPPRMLKPGVSVAYLVELARRFVGTINEKAVCEIPAGSLRLLHLEVVGRCIWMETGPAPPTHMEFAGVLVPVFSQADWTPLLECTTPTLPGFLRLVD